MVAVAVQAAGRTFDGKYRLAFPQDSKRWKSSARGLGDLFHSTSLDFSTLNKAFSDGGGNGRQQCLAVAREAVGTKALSFPAHCFSSKRH